ncbi:hypothetical protein GMOD_00009414 [Pyrenophora seminiperda CCB06]|uniref:Uncharacterized protein n=1 Tax=Pyrenophora seminiperda CCB06 TaxID=1302712 RepID=A0A3M7MGK8_9PLEO|nr:hypothetical protein GMOD_00009414 [Pyrenophora seminiperda CCB06]
MYPSEKDSHLPPPYSEHIPTSSSSSSSSSRNHTLLNQLSTTRTRQIHNVLTTHVIPLIEERATYGIAQTTLALLPSDISLPAVVPEKSEFSFDNNTTSDSAPPVQVIGFTSEDEPKVVRLEGQMNRTEFWRSQAVIEELEQVLSRSLNKSPVLTGTVPPPQLDDDDDDDDDDGRAEDVIISSTRQSTKRRTLLSRVMPSLGPEMPSPSGNPEVGVRRRDSASMVVVKARLEEICLRTVSDFGLYDTLSKQCVIIRVDARC